MIELSISQHYFISEMLVSLRVNSSNTAKSENQAVLLTTRNITLLPILLSEQQLKFSRGNSKSQVCQQRNVAKRVFSLLLVFIRF